MQTAHFEKIGAVSQKSDPAPVDCIYTVQFSADIWGFVLTLMGLPDKTGISQIVQNKVLKIIGSHKKNEGKCENCRHY